MKNFMLIFKGTHYSDLGLSPEEMQGKLEKWMNWSKKMGEEGILRGGHALTGDIRTVKGNDKLITDMSSAELKEIVGGFYMIEVADLNSATEVAKDYPDFDLGGTVEVREVMVYG